MIPRIVLDTSDHVKSILYPPGASGVVLDFCASGHCQLVCSPSILTEIRDVLSRSRIRRRYPKITDQAVDSYILHLEAFADMVPGTLMLTGASRDPNDDHILSCAVEGQASYLVTADQGHLLSLVEFQGIKIVTAAQFLAVVRLQE